MSGILVALAAALAVGVGAGAASANVPSPVIVPSPDSLGVPNATSSPACYRQGGPIGDNTWLTCLLPELDAVVDWPDQSTNVWPAPRSFILPKPGTFATWLGETQTEIGRPLVWNDVGSGVPIASAGGGYSFPLAGKYAWECLVCSGIERQKLQGTMYVIGPRPMISYKLVSSDNSGTHITYSFDASGSFVTDYTPHQIVEYAFDFQDDGTFDQVTPGDPTGEATYAPGPHTVRINVKDDTGRTATYPLFFEVPVVRAPDPTDGGTPAEPTRGGAPGDGAPGGGSGPPPPPRPAPLQYGGHEGLSISGGADYTNDPRVTLNVVAPLGTTSLLVANDGGFTQAQSLPVSLTGRYPWRLRSTGQERLPKVVYLRFVGGLGIDVKTFTDDIILDQTKPKVTSAAFTPGGQGQASAAARRSVRVKGSDNLSGIGGVQITGNRAKPGRTLKPARQPARSRTLNATFPAPATRGSLWVRVIDRAGNASAWRSVTG